MTKQIHEDFRLAGVAQVLVYLRSPTEGKQMLTAEAKRLTPFLAASAQSSAVASDTVLSLRKHFTTSEFSPDGALATAGLEPNVPFAGRAPTPMRYYPNLGIMIGTVHRAGFESLRHDSAVAKVKGLPLLLPIRPGQATAARLTRRRTWGLEKLGIPKLWDQGLRGEGIIVGHLDTGVDGSHAAFQPDAIHGFAEFDLMGFQTANTQPRDTDDHGTHTAGTIAGRPVNGRSIGVAPAAKLASAIVIEGGNAVARVLAGMDWSVGQGVRILNMSLGFTGYVTNFLDLTRLLRRRGILPVFAVGNEGPGTSRSPGNYPEALSVGAIDQKGRVADFSSSRRFQRRREPIVPDLVAPGVEVISAAPGGRYQSMPGTSMATPHISGLAALLMQAKPRATVAQVERAIFASCERSGLPRERANRGIPNGPRALRSL